MKLLEIFRFELAYQARRLSTALCFAVLALASFLFVRGGALSDALFNDFYLNSPFIIASTTVFTSLLWFLVAAPVAGEIAARDAETGMDPLTYTAPTRRAEHLGGRFLAAFALNALLLLAVPLGILLAVYASGVDARVVGPFRPVSYLAAYGFIALPNAFAGTAIQFAFAALARRALASYVGSVLLVFVAYGGVILLGFMVGQQDVAMLFDVFGHIYITSDLVLGWTPVEKNTRLIVLEGGLLRSRATWTCVGAAALAVTLLRFRFAHPGARRRWLPSRRRAGAPTPSRGELARGPVAIPAERKSFGPASRALQTLALARESYAALVWSRIGLPVMAALAAVVVLVLPQHMDSSGTPLLPRTEHVLTYLTAPLNEPLTPWIVLPLLIVLYAGELAWRERNAGLGAIMDASPVPEWVLLAGKFLGLAGAIATWMAALLAAGVGVQLRMGFHEHEIGLFARVLFGLQLPPYLFFALLALVVQGMVAQKYAGHMVALLAYALLLFAPRLGVRHNLLVFGSAPAWSYTDMRGFGPTLGPWLWFMAYWAAWSLLLAVAARLLWVRGMEAGAGARLRGARRRLTRPTAGAAALALALVLSLGGFIFYNTNVLNAYSTPEARAGAAAEYERRYARYAALPQPRLVASRLRVEIHPRRRALEVRGTYHLVNGTRAPISQVLLSTVPGPRTEGVTFDRKAARVVEDDARGFRVYALAEPLRPGDSLRVGFEVRVEPRGFRNSGVSFAVMPKSTFFRNEGLLPVVGYLRGRELFAPADRRRHGLAARPIVPRLTGDGAQEAPGEAPGDSAAATRIDFEAVVGTDADQVAVAPGVLRRSWTEGGRRYFHYATDAPIAGEQTFLSARYAVHEEVWSPPAGRPVSIQVYHHPRHGANLGRIVRSVRASLEYNTRAFGPYPYGYIRLVENPGRGMGAHASASMIDYTEGFSRYNPRPDGLDFPFAVIAHEMGHQWQVPHAFVEGAPLLSESFAWYAALGAVESEYGREHLRRLMRTFRQPRPIPQIRQSTPLLRALDPYAAYRKGPFALFAMGEYMGADRVNLAFRRLRERHGAGAPPLATSLDLYRELRAVTPDSLRPLLHDLFAANTFWDFRTERASAVRTPDGAWRVTLRVRARKLTVDPAGWETEVPMDEWVQVGAFGPSPESSAFGETLHLRMHRIRTGEQTITVTVPRKPADAGVDPFHVLIESERFDNVEPVEVGE